MGIKAIGAFLLAAALAAVFGTSHAPAHVWPGKGELAVVSHGQLVLFAGDARQRTVPGPGQPASPAWSPDGRWVAFLRVANAESGMAELWVARSNGAQAHRLSPVGEGVAQFAWSPGSPGTLAFSPWGPVRGASRVLVVTPTSKTARTLASFPELIGFSWAPSGKSIAISYREGTPPTGEGFVEILPLEGHGRRVIATFPNFGYGELACWWKGGKGLLYWDDPAGSASIAADGLSLESFNLSTGKVAALATTLTYRNWLALSPDGRSVAVVDGGDRVVWGSGKHVEVCALATGKCRPQPLPSPDEVSLDPVFTARGPLVYDVAPGTASPGFSLVPGVTGAPGAPFSTQDVDSWYGLQRLYVAGPTGAHPLPGTGAGAHDPLATAGGLLFVQASALWYLAGGQRRAEKVADELDGPGNYYGYAPWYQDFAWHS